MSVYGWPATNKPGKQVSCLSIMDPDKSHKCSWAEQAFRYTAALSIIKIQVGVDQMIQIERPYKVTSLTERLNLGEQWSNISGQILQKLRETRNAKLYEATGNLVDVGIHCQIVTRLAQKHLVKTLVGILLKKVWDELLPWVGVGNTDVIIASPYPA